MGPDHGGEASALARLLTARRGPSQSHRLMEKQLPFPATLSPSRETQPARGHPGLSSCRSPPLHEGAHHEGGSWRSSLHPALAG